jgi:hypothetical protein
MDGIRFVTKDLKPNLKNRRVNWQVKLYRFRQRDVSRSEDCLASTADWTLSPQKVFACGTAPVYIAAHRKSTGQERFRFTVTARFLRRVSKTSRPLRQ